MHIEEIHARPDIRASRLSFCAARRFREAELFNSIAGARIELIPGGSSQMPVVVIKPGSGVGPEAADLRRKRHRSGSRIALSARRTREDMRAGSAVRFC